MKIARAGAALFLLAAVCPAAPPLKMTGISAAGVVSVSYERRAAVVKAGQAVGPWTLMAVIARVAVFENFADKAGHMLFLTEAGVVADLPKSLEPTFADPRELYRGHSLSEVKASETDLLGDEILAQPGDPQYDEVARCFPPIVRMKTHTFLGTHESFDKVAFEYGGVTPHFDPAAYAPEIRRIRAAGKVWDGLIGGWLPVLRYVYPEDSGAWTEMAAYAPMRFENGNRWIQPVWYRVARVENGRLKWARYFDSYHPFPPRLEQRAEPFYEQLLAMRAGWSRALDSAMRIDIPDRRLADMAKLSLVRDMMTRIGDQPKYGVADRNYGGSEHDGFPDTFNADTTAMNEWGVLSLAARYIENYFGQFVRDDGSILYRGPETGQYGRMLTVAAQYANYSGDFKLLLKHRRRLDAVANLLLSMRRKAQQLAPDDPAYGMISGWSEADACLDPDPQRYMQPYFSNSTEAARGFRDLGAVWERSGRESGSLELIRHGRSLMGEAATLERDIQTAIARSMFKDLKPAFLPAIAGAKEPFHVAVARDPLDPLFRSYRPYMEMLYSGSLTRAQVETILRYRSGHRDLLLGVPTAYGYGTYEMAGFLSYGHGYGLIQHDFVREYLMTLYGIMAHQYTRGNWTAPETRPIDGPRDPWPYCTPAQMVVPLFARWMLVFEDPRSETLWLVKAAPREWMEDGKKIAVENAPTRWGRIGYTVVSHVDSGRADVELRLPRAAFPAAIRIRLRAAGGRRIQSVSGGATFDADDETVTLAAGKYAGTVSVAIRYR